ncbi:MAG TPA: SBBP repeat-containing protein [Tepidisphaeraceae bacterium]|nr:SBBP repeat-containing protein [Tepidisphaeraceae bacterium]
MAQAVMQTLEERRLFAATPTLDFSTYFGGASEDFGDAVAVDASGNYYLAGTTTSSSGVASGGNDTTYSGGIFSGDALLAKFDPSGKLLWSTYIGGGSAKYDDINAISLDSDGNVYVAGTSISTGWVSGGYNTSLSGAADGFVAKFTASGAAVWSTYVGGSGDDRVYDLHVTGKGAVTVVGQTDSTDLGSGGFDNTNSGGVDGFITRITAAGKLSYSAYIGGAGTDKANSVTMGLDGSFYVAGETDSDSGFVADGFDTSFGGGLYDGFVFQVKPDATKGWSTYMGGSDLDKAAAIALAPDDQIIVGGTTDSDGWASGGYDTDNRGNDAFVARLTTAATKKLVLPSRSVSFSADRPAVGIGVAGDVHAVLRVERNSTWDRCNTEHLCGT